GQRGGEAIGSALSNSEPPVQSLATAAYGVTTQVGVLLPYYRKQESDADHIVLLYMARAGYDPEEAVRFWQRFAEYNTQSGNSGGLALLRTHPVDSARIQQLKQLLPEAKAQYRPQVSTR